MGTGFSPSRRLQRKLCLSAPFTKLCKIIEPRLQCSPGQSTQVFGIRVFSSQRLTRDQMEDPGSMAVSKPLEPLADTLTFRSLVYSILSPKVNQDISDILNTSRFHLAGKIIAGRPSWAQLHKEWWWCPALPFSQLHSEPTCNSPKEPPPVVQTELRILLAHT